MVQYNDNDICSVCLEDLNSNIQKTNLVCGHTFHVNCIINCLRKSNECPYCRDTDGNPKISVSNNNELGFFFDDESEDTAYNQTLEEYNDFINTMKSIEKEDIDLKESINKLVLQSKNLEKKSTLVSKKYDKDLNDYTNEFLQNYKKSSDYNEYILCKESYKKQHTKLIQQIKKKISKKLDFEIDNITVDYIRDYLEEKRAYSDYYYFKLPVKMYL